jgi:amino acid adenylation domain-containing protein
MNVAVELERQASYWREELAGAPTKLELPTDKPRPAAQSLRSARESFALSAELLQKLRSLGAEEGATLFMTLGAGFIVLLNRYTGQSDILVAAPLAAGSGADGASGRTNGSPPNPVVLRAKLTDHVPFRALLRQVKERTLRAHAHADLPFETLVGELVRDRDASHAPLCQVMFVLENAEEVARASKGSNGASHESESARADLTLFLAETAGGIDAAIAYATDLFEAETIRRMCGHYGVLLEAAVSEPDRSIHTLPMLTLPERAQLLHEWNDTHAELPPVATPALFEEAVLRHPDATALVFEGETTTYRALNERANQVAHYLRRRGVGADVRVGVCMERSPEIVVALLGVLKAGGAYVPLDPAYPKDRLAYMVRDSAAKVLLTDAKHRDAFSAGGERPVCLDSDWGELETESTQNPGVAIAPDDLAYVMYTSGSTGEPKGVMVHHRGVVNYLSWAGKAYAAAAGGAVPLHTSIAFDLTVTALFVPLCAGGQVEVLRDDVGGQNLVAALREGSGRSLVKITPAHLALLSEQVGQRGAAGRTNLFVIGGENLTAESLALWRDFAPGTRLINEYGPTETVVGCCVYEVRPEDPRTGSVPIGRPIANTQLYILDRHLNPLPVGAVGELYIGGAGVARGYLNRAELTKERFIPDPFSSEPGRAGAAGGRLYKTGDIARYRPDGTLEYFGRIDNQVKVRGYRIELGEIEAKLADHPGVKVCAVLAREDTPGNKQLVGYVVPQKDEAPSVSSLREYLRERLPEYMVPSQFVFLASMPLTTNGKVDRKGLPAPSEENTSPAQTRVAPRTPIEKALAAIWSELLHLENIGIHDDFFDLGGHSLLAIKAVARVREVLAVELSPQAVIDSPTIAELATTLGDVAGREAEAPITLPARGLASVRAAAAAKLAPELGPDGAVSGIAPKVGARRGPLFFGDPQLFGFFHPASSKVASDAALLVCPPLGHEHTRAYRAVQSLCDAAARAGVAAFRFDYTGVGDSSGELSNGGLDVWCADVLRAAGELRSRSGAREVHVVGLRLGAALAALALKRAGRETPAVSSLCLWDPVLSGGELLKVAAGFQDAFVRDPGRFSEETMRRLAARRAAVEDPILGYSFSAPLRRSLEELDQRRAEAWPAVPIRAVLSERAGGWEELATRLEAGGWRVSTESVKGAGGHWGDYARHEKPLRAGPVIARIVEQLAGKHG